MLWPVREAWALATTDALAVIGTIVVGDGAARVAEVAIATARDNMFGFIVVLMWCDKFAATISCGFA